MKAFKYIGTVLLFGLIYIAGVFMLPSIAAVFRANTSVFVFTGLGVVLAAEYLFVWFRLRKRFFSIPISFGLVILIGLFYFNHPSTAEFGLGMWVLIQKFVLPYAVCAAAVSLILFIVNKKI